MKYPVLLAVGLFSAVNLLVSGAAFAQANGYRQVAGTSDSGGGPGYNGKVMESFIVDPLALPAYTEYVAKWWSRIQSEDPEYTLPMIAKSKVWFIAPVDFENVLTKKAVGVTFIKNRLQPPALQTREAVWIRKVDYDPSTTLEQAKLLLHEQVEMMYFLKFQTLTEICHMGTLITAKAGRCDDDEANKASKLLPPLPWRALDATDYANIEFVTSWIVHNDKNVSYEDFKAVLEARGFDKRLFASAKKTSTLNIVERKLSKREVVESVRATDMIEGDNFVCTGLKTKIVKPCRLKAEVKMHRWDQYPLPGVEVELSIAGESPIRYWTFMGDEIYSPANKEADGKTVFFVPTDEVRSQNRFGDRQFAGYMLFTTVGWGPATNLILDSAILRQGRIVSIDKARSPVCLLRESRATTLAEDSIYIARKGSKPGVLVNALLQNPPNGTCSPTNVTE